MSGRKTSRRKRRNNIKSLVIALALAAAAAAVVGTSAAYIHHSSKSVVNTFAPSEITCKITETVEAGVKSSVKIKNTGITAAYIRAAVIANSVDEEGAINGAADVESYLGGENWVKSGMYYYYTQPVAPNGLTGELLTGSIDLNGIQVTILAEAIESMPASAAQDAWGTAPGDLAGN